LHTYMVPHMVNWICCNSCNSSNNTHSIEICWFVINCKWSLQLKNIIARLVVSHLIFHCGIIPTTTKILNILMPMLKYIFKKQLKSTCASPHAWKQDWHCEKPKVVNFQMLCKTKYQRLIIVLIMLIMLIMGSLQQLYTTGKKI
jgi:hypothetical protein